MKLIFSLCLFLLILDASAQGKWLLEKDLNGVQIYTRKLENFSVKEFKAITYSTKTISEFERILEDVENYPNWVYSVTEGKLIMENDTNNRLLYYSIDIPWPVSDRDIVITSSKSKNTSGSLRFDMTAVLGQKNENPNFVRMKEAFGSWQFIPQDDGKVKIVYQFYGNPGGNIPAWMVNMMIVEGPYETLVNLRDL